MIFGRKKVAVAEAPGFPAPVAAAAASAPEALLDGIRYVGMVSPPGTYVEAMRSPMPCAGRSGGAGVRFDIETKDGAGYAFVFPHFASIWINGEAAPRPEIPTEMIARQIRAYASEAARLFDR